MVLSVLLLLMMDLVFRYTECFFYIFLLILNYSLDQSSFRMEGEEEF